MPSDRVIRALTERRARFRLAIKRLAPRLRAARQQLKLPALFLVLGGCAFALQRFGSPFFSSLGGNLISDFITAAILLYGIDVLVKDREERRLLPLRASVYRGVNGLVGRCLRTWHEAYERSVGTPHLKSWQELFSEDVLHKIFLQLDLGKKAPTTDPALKWFHYLDERFEGIRKSADQILDRNGVFLDPQVHHDVSRIASFITPKMAEFEKLDKRMGYPRPRCLYAYHPKDDEWFATVLRLLGWCEDTHRYLKRHGMAVSTPPILVSNRLGKTLGSARFDDGELEAQAKAWDDFQEASAKKAVARRQSPPED